jgi:glycosidase
MAADTPAFYRNLVIYEIYVRNHGPNGTFADVTADLPRIRKLGVDVVWFMPVHPIGRLNKKGRLGCPYSIVDYRALNPDYGSEADFAALIEAAHDLGLRVMIDVVYNHTAHDAELIRRHPEWYHRGDDGRPVTTVPAWSDVIDLDYDDPALWDYQVETLQQWASFGVDGFRCDVASIVPLAFWQRARQEVARVKPNVIWLAESVHARFVDERRRQGLTGHSDGELYTAFDLTYDYDIWPIWETAVAGQVPVGRYLEMVRFQDAIYPANYVKMRCVENHDQPRIMRRAPSRHQALAWTAFQAFNQGAFLIYAGQESENRHTPDLFDLDKVRWGDYSLSPFLSRLARLKKDPIQIDGLFALLIAQPLIGAAWQGESGGLLGLFNVRGHRGDTAVPLPDGAYEDVLNLQTVKVHNGRTSIPETAAILRYAGHIETEPFHSHLLDGPEKLKVKS